MALQFSLKKFILETILFSDKLKCQGNLINQMRGRIVYINSIDITQN